MISKTYDTNSMKAYYEDTVRGFKNALELYQAHLKSEGILTDTDKDNITKAATSIERKYKYTNIKVTQWAATELVIPYVLTVALKQTITDILDAEELGDIEIKSYYGEVIRSLMYLRYFHKAKNVLSEAKFHLAFSRYNELLQYKPCRKVVINVLHDVDPELIDDDFLRVMIDLPSDSQHKKQILSW